MAFIDSTRVRAVSVEAATEAAAHNERNAFLCLPELIHLKVLFYLDYESNYVLRAVCEKLNVLRKTPSMWQNQIPARFLISLSTRSDKPIIAMAITKNREWLAMVDTSGRIDIYYLDDDHSHRHTYYALVEFGNGATYMEFSPGSDKLLIACVNHRMLYVYDFRAGLLARRLKVGNRVVTANFWSDNDNIFIGDYVEFNLRNFAVVYLLNVNNNVRRLVVSVREGINHMIMGAFENSNFIFGVFHCNNGVGMHRIPNDSITNLADEANIGNLAVPVSARLTVDKAYEKVLSPDSRKLYVTKVTSDELGICIVDVDSFRIERFVTVASLDESLLSCGRNGYLLMATMYPNFCDGRTLQVIARCPETTVLVSFLWSPLDPELFFIGQHHGGFTFYVSRNRYKATYS